MPPVRPSLWPCRRPRPAAPPAPPTPTSSCNIACSRARFTAAREFADDLARELNGDSGEGSFHGVFVAAGDSPTDAELADARRRLREFQEKLVAAADLEWERSHNPMFITDLERRAARQLGLEKPWLYDPKPTIECPVCAERIKPGVAVCRACGAILDREKAARFGLARAPRKERQRNPEPQAEQRNEAGS